MKKNKSRNEKIYTSIQKTHFHGSRRNLPEKDPKRKYSAAFMVGDHMGYLPEGSNGLLTVSRSFDTNYEKKAYWRGVKNRHRRDKK